VYCFDLIEDHEDGILMSWFEREAEEKEGLSLFESLCSVDVLGEVCGEEEEEPEVVGEEEVKEDGAEEITSVDENGIYAKGEEDEKKEDERDEL
jgi:hypothetical protein